MIMRGMFRSITEHLIEEMLVSYQGMLMHGKSKK